MRKCEQQQIHMKHKYTVSHFVPYMVLWNPLNRERVPSRTHRQAHYSVWLYIYTNENFIPFMNGSFVIRICGNSVYGCYSAANTVTPLLCSKNWIFFFIQTSLNSLSTKFSKEIERKKIFEYCELKVLSIVDRFFVILIFFANHSM